MVDIDALIEKAQHLKGRGLSEKDIADELHLSVETVNWLLTKGVEGEMPPSDVKIGWRSMGVFGRRMQNLANILSDIIEEEMEKHETHCDSVLGIAINGVPLATLVSVTLDKEFMILRPSREEKLGGAFSSNYAGCKGKNIVLVDDVIGSGDTMRNAIREVRDHGGNPVLIVAILNKGERNDILGVPLRALIRARSVGGTIIGMGPIPSFPYA